MRKTIAVVKHTGLLGRLCCWAHQKEMQIAWWMLCDRFIPKFNECIDGWNKLYTSLYGDDTSTIWKRMKYDKFISRHANELFNRMTAVMVYRVESPYHVWMCPRYTNKGLRFDLVYRGHRLHGCGYVSLKCKNV